MTAALDLAAAGWAVFPCQWRPGATEKSPLTEHGHRDASRDRDVIRSWWARWPLAMIGAPVPESLLVIDLDPRNNPRCLAELEELVGPILDTLTAWSGRNDGGRHFYFLRPAGQLTSTRLPTGVDLKVNGYCIVPPSLHPATGQPYRWDQRPATALSNPLRSLLRPPVAPARPFRRPGGRGTGRALIDWVAARSSNVNDAVFWAARKAAGDGILDDIEADLVAAADQAARAAGTWTSTGERQTRKTIGSARAWVARVGAR